MASDPITVVLEQTGDYAFHVRFEGLEAELHTDESPPLGRGEGPNPARLLLAAIANCLSASLVFALRKFHNTPGPLRATITAVPMRNAQGRVRIPQAQVVLELPGLNADYQHLERVLDTFEDFCTVTQSVRDGMDVEVTVRDAAGHVLHGEPQAGEAGA